MVIIENFYYEDEFNVKYSFSEEKRYDEKVITLQM